MSNESTTDRTGACLCGAVKVTAKGCKPNAGTCHCGMCRRWASGPMMMTECAELAIEDEAHVRTYPSSDWGERGFCDTCGTHLFWRLRAGGVTVASTGLFDDTEGLVFDHQIFIDSKPAWYTFANETKDMTGAEVMAMFSGGSG